VPLTVLSVAYALAPVGPGAVGGAEQVLGTIDEGLVRAGHRSMVVACQGSRTRGTLIATPTPQKPLDTAGGRAWEAHRAAIESALRRERVDVVHFHGLDFPRYLPRNLTCPALATLHLPPSWYAPDVFSLPGRGIHLNCVSESQRQACPEGASLLDTIPNGIPLNRFRPAGGRGSFLAALGRICPEKGFHLALEAARRANLPLLLAGDVFAYEAHQRYFNEEIAPRLDRLRRFVGPVGPRAKWRLLSHARALLIPSLVPETSSLAAMEALACGTPVLAFRQGALPEIVEHGRTGFLVDDLDGMLEALSHLDRIDGRECRARAEERFSAESMVARYLSTYERLVSVHRALRRSFHNGTDRSPPLVPQWNRSATGAGSTMEPTGHRGWFHNGTDQPTGVGSTMEPTGHRGWFHNGTDQPTGAGSTMEPTGHRGWFHNETDPPTGAGSTMEPTGQRGWVHNGTDPPTGAGSTMEPTGQRGWVHNGTDPPAGAGSTMEPTGGHCTGRASCTRASPGDGRRGAASRRERVEVLTEPAQLAGIQTAWRELWHRVPDAPPFVHPDWLLPWCRHFGRARVLATAVWKEEALVGLAPMEIWRQSDTRVLKLLGAGVSDALDVLVAPSYEARVLPALLDSWQQERASWDDCELAPLRAHSSLVRADLPGWGPAAACDVSPALDLRAGRSLEELVPRRIAQNVRYAWRRLERAGLLSVERGDERSASELFGALVRLHAARWRMRGGRGVLDDPSAQAFHRDVVEGFGRREGMLRLLALRLDGCVVAVLYGFAAHGRCHYYLSGFDPELHKLSVGSVVIAQAIEDSRAAGDRCFDFLRGAEPYKYAWGARDVPLFRRACG
jgi:CelD/BcsL family acetyltransferase involved in cellulose biosynthesis/glycosyltransferase involved in cell wall biosynthesis